MLKILFRNKPIVSIFIILFLLVIFAPHLSIGKIYFSSNDIKYFLTLVKKHDELGIRNLIFYYTKKKEKNNLKYLNCYLKSHEVNQNCPKNPLSFIKNKVTIWDYLEYKITSLSSDVHYTTADGRGGTSQLYIKGISPSYKELREKGKVK